MITACGFSIVPMSCPHAAVLHAAVLRATVLRATVLRATVLRATVLRATVLRATVLQATVLRATVLHATVLHATLRQATFRHATFRHALPACRQRSLRPRPHPDPRPAARRSTQQRPARLAAVRSAPVFAQAAAGDPAPGSRCPAGRRGGLPCPIPMPPRHALLPRTRLLLRSTPAAGRTCPRAAWSCA